jgi:para-nitrobenzyl esterase
VSLLGGSAYADSVNVGMTELVAALQWVRDNITNFGADPNTIMIYGQSGGGSKVTTLLGMQSAEGLIHRASAQSGGGGNPPSAEKSRSSHSGCLRSSESATLRRFRKSNGPG